MANEASLVFQASQDHIESPFIQKASEERREDSGQKREKEVAHLLERPDW